MASFIFAESSFFCTRATSSGSTSAAMVRFHLVQRALPVGRGQLQASGFLVQIAEVVEDSRVGIDFLQREGRRPRSGRPRRKRLSKGVPIAGLAVRLRMVSSKF